MINYMDYLEILHKTFNFANDKLPIEKQITFKIISQPNHKLNLCLHL